MGFYQGVLGLEVMQRVGGSAAFLSAGGYHDIGVIAVEKLNVKGMVQNHCLAKSISDAA